MTAPTHTERSVASGSGYEQGCRCDRCKEAHRQRVNRRRHERMRAREFIDGRLVATAARRHGVMSTYANWGCRCEPCTVVATDTMRRYDEQRRAAS